MKVSRLSKVRPHTRIGIVPHKRDGEVGADAEADNSVTCAFDSLGHRRDNTHRFPLQHPVAALQNKADIIPRA